MLVLTHTFTSIEAQVSRLGTESFILMEFLIAVALFSCDSNVRLISRIEESKESEQVKLELIDSINSETDQKCFKDAKAD